MIRLLAGLVASLVLTAPAGAAKHDHVVEQSMNKVVLIEVHGLVEDFESDESTKTVKKEAGWVGSGAFISSDGLILTCDHLFIRKLEDRQIVVKTSTGKLYRAILLAENHKADLALLKVFPLHSLAHFTIGQPIARGQRVYAFGAPLLIEKTVSIGYVENLSVGPDHRTLHSAAINPGNSGGPLVDEAGQLVGVNVSILMMNPFVRAEGMEQAVSLHDIRLFLRD